MVKYISDRIAVMHFGKIVELGSADEIYNNPLHPYTKSLLSAVPQPDPESERSRKEQFIKKKRIMKNKHFMKFNQNIMFCVLRVKRINLKRI